MAPVTRARSSSPGRTAAMVVLLIIGVLAIIAGILYFTEPAKSLPAVLGTITHPASRADAHRSTRAWVALVVGVVCLVVSWPVGRAGRS